MKKTVMFDIDGTLIDYKGGAIAENVDLFLFFQSMGYDVGVWSQAGAEHAGAVANSLGLEPRFVMAKNTSMGNKMYPDIAVDDLNIHIARTMIKVHDDPHRTMV